MLHRGLNSGRSQATLFYHVIKTNYPEAFDMEIGPELLNKFAASLNIERRTEDAIFFQEKNCNVFPGDPSVHFELGKLYHQSGNPGRAIEEYNKTLEIDPGHKGALEALSKIRILS